MNQKKLVQFGAGNIGRSFIGQLFSAVGYEVVFVDVNPALIRLLNTKREYRVVIKADSGDSVIPVRNVRAVDGRDTRAVADEITHCSYMATSVGQGALPHIFPVIAAGLNSRKAASNNRPVDIIIAENIRRGSEYFKTEIGRCVSELTFSALGKSASAKGGDGGLSNSPGLPDGCLEGRPESRSGWSGWLAEKVGLVETSIGKMVPIMTAADLAADPLQVFAEPYNTLILDRTAFKGPLPNIPSLQAVSNIAAYVDRKLFIHNLGHATAAYLGHQRDTALTYIWECLTFPDILSATRRVMAQAAAALQAEYPDVFSHDDLLEHIDDLLSRFQNRALGDTIHRVGRDLRRKLGRDDRIVGAILLAVKHNLPWEAIGKAYKAALKFRPRESDFPPDQDFRREFAQTQKTEQPILSIKRVLTEVSKLDPADPTEKRVIENLVKL